MDSGSARGGMTEERGKARGVYDDDDARQFRFR
jgi:hypothetical protein